MPILVAATASRRRSCERVRSFIVLLLVALTFVGATTVAPHAAGSTTAKPVAPDGLQFVGRLDTNCPIPPGFTIPFGVDESLGVLVLLLPCSNQLAVFSTRNDRLLATTVVTGTVFRTIPIDPVHHLIFLASQGAAGGTNVITVYSLLALMNGQSRVVRTISIPDDAVVADGSAASSPGSAPPVSGDDPSGTAGDFSLAPAGAAVDASTGRLYIAQYEDWGNTDSATSAHGPGNQDVYVVAIDIARAGIMWSMPLGKCASPGVSVGRFDEPIVVARAGTSHVLAVGCLAAKASPLPGTSSGTTGAAGIFGTGVSITGFGSTLTYRIPLSPSGAVGGAISYDLGRTNGLYGIADPDSGRLYWVTAPPFESGAASDAGPAAVLYDPIHNAYVEAPTVGSPAVISGGFAIGGGGGRLYSAGPSGFAVLDAKGEGGQGSLYPGFACRADMVAVDGHLHRIFILPEASCTTFDNRRSDPPYLLVYDDNIRNLGSAPSVDPDSYTRQIAEQRGLTVRSYGGHAEATGVRLRVIGGGSGLVRGLTFGSSHPLEQALQQHGVAPDTSTREVELAQVHLADLDSYHAGAVADAALADDATSADIRTTGLTWPFDSSHETSCSAPGSERAASTTYSDDVASQTDCDMRTTSASTAAGALGMILVGANQPPGSSTVSLLPLRVGTSEASSSVKLDPARGLIASSQSVVRSVVVGPIEISRIRTTVVCSAHGRRGTADCSFEREVSGIMDSSGALALPNACEDTVAGGRTSQGCAPLISVLNQIYPPYLHFSMSMPDQRRGYIAGSPGGYQSIGQREYYEHLQDSFIDYDNSQEIPGLEILYVNDSAQSPSRLDVQLASVESESRYGINVNPTGCAFPCGAGISQGEMSAHRPEDQIPFVLWRTHGMHAQTFTPLAGPPGFSLSRRVVDGIRWLLRSPGELLPIASLLLLLASPLGLAFRRRHLDHLHR